MPILKKFEIDPQTINDTECDKNFICLTDEPLYCSVCDSMGQSMVRLACKDLLECRHNKSYGALHLCDCPVRNEIFRKYRV